MKKYSLLSLGLAVAFAVLGNVVPAQAGYYHEMLNPENTPAIAAASLPAGCRLLADDITNLRPIYINCNDVNGLSATPIAGSFTTILASGAITGGAASNIAINTNKFTVAASSGNTLVAGTLAVTGVTTATGDILANGGVDGILGGVTPAAATVTTLTASSTATFGAGSSIVAKTSTSATDINPPFDNRILGNPVVKYVYGSCTVAAVNAGTCIPLALGTGRTISVLNYDIVAAGSAATCTGILLEDTTGSPVVVSTIAAAALTSGTHNFPGIANNVLGVGFGAGSGLTASQGVQIKVNGSGCTTTTAFQYAITYTVQ